LPTVLGLAGRAGLKNVGFGLIPAFRINLAPAI
jgi:hypothetical protein